MQLCLVGKSRHAEPLAVLRDTRLEEPLGVLGSLALIAVTAKVYGVCDVRPLALYVVADGSSVRVIKHPADGFLGFEHGVRAALHTL